MFIASIRMFVHIYCPKSFYEIIVDCLCCMNIVAV